MKTKVTKEQALKAILFVTVATTISWPYGNHPQSIDLASELISVDTATAQPQDDVKPLTMAPDTMMLPVGKVKMPTRPKPVSKNTNPISKKPLLHTSGKVTVCGVPLILTLDEKTDGRTVRTEVIISEANHPAGNELIAFPDTGMQKPGSFAELGITKESIHKDVFEKTFKPAIEKLAHDKLTEIGRCGDIAPVQPAQPEEGDQGAQPETSSTRSPRDDAAAIANCMIDARTHRANRSSDVLQCNIGKLEKLGQMDDGDSRNSSRVARELTRIVKNGIYMQLKTLLMSSNSDDQSRAQDMIDDLISRIEDLGSQFNISNSQTTALTNSLRGLKAGADAFTRANDMRQDVTQLRKDIADARGQGQNGQQGQVPQYLMSQLHDLQTKLQTEIAQGPIQELNQYSQYMQARDVKLFTAPYEQLQRDLQAISGQQGGQYGQNGQQQLGPNGQPIGGQFGGQQLGPNGIPIGGQQLGPNGIPINGGYPGGIQGAPGVLPGGVGAVPYGQPGYGVGGNVSGYGPQAAAYQQYIAQQQQQAAYQQYLAQMQYSNGGIIAPSLIQQGSPLIGRQGSPWQNGGLITNGAFQNNGVATSILPAQFVNTGVIGGSAVGSPFRNGSTGFGVTGSAFGATGSVFGTTGSVFGGGGNIINRPPPPPINAGLYGGGFSGSGYYNRNLPVAPPSRIAPAVLPLSGTSYGLNATTTATPFR